MIKKILVSMDGSDNAFRALDVAISIAKQCNASITLLHSIYEESHSEFAMVEEIDSETEEAIKKFLDKAEKMLDEKNVERFTKLIQGNIRYSIVEYVNSEKGFDMVVVGSRGRGGFKKMLMGSVSNHVIQAAEIPVLVVK